MRTKQSTEPSLVTSLCAFLLIQDIFNGHSAQAYVTTSVFLIVRME